VDVSIYAGSSSCMSLTHAHRLDSGQLHFQLYDMIYIFNCNWVATRWQLFSTHIHTNNTGNDTKQTMHRTTQKMHRATKKLGRVRAVPRLCGYHPGICLTTEEKAQEKSQSG
jgi:hypothetical protein